MQRDIHRQRVLRFARALVKAHQPHSPFSSSNDFNGSTKFILFECVYAYQAGDLLVAKVHDEHPKRHSG